jgi:predicted alternative tryptophan synthase beta-subunit
VLCKFLHHLQVACTGGGSNFGGLTFPILTKKMAGNMNPELNQTPEPDTLLFILASKQFFI